MPRGWRKGWKRRFRDAYFNFSSDSVNQILPVPVKNPEYIILTKEELEALRLVDYLGLTQEEASLKLGVSRPTVSRIVNSARKKIVQAIIEGRPIYIA